MMITAAQIPKFIEYLNPLYALIAMKLTYISPITEGKMNKSISQEIAKNLCHFEGKRVKFTIETYYPQRSNQQNKLFWAYVTILAGEIGLSKEEMGDLIKMKFLKKSKIIEETGEVIEYLGSTTELNKMDFSNFINELVAWAATTLNVTLPEPNSQINLL